VQPEIATSSTPSSNPRRAPYAGHAASAVAEDLDEAVLTLLRDAAG
jgi:hypothetical protein